MTTLHVSLPDVLEKYLTPQQFKRYVKPNKGGQVGSPQHYYNSALRDLSIRDTEAAIFNLIKVFELEPKHLPALHLARTMLFGLNKLFKEAGGEMYRAKYPNINSYRQKIEKELQEKEIEEQRVRNEITTLKNKKGGLFGRLFGGGNPAQKIQSLNARLTQIPQEIAELQRRRSQAIKMIQIQEYANVVSLILEICMFPARYSWVNQGKKKEEDAGFQNNIWYG